jgi:hypothetical protein
LRAGAGAPRIAATYDYKDEKGQLLYQVVRLEPKSFRQRRPDGHGGWEWNLRGVRRCLYRLPELARSPRTAVFVVEGEKDADALAARRLLATTCPGGAGKWRGEYSAALRGRAVCVIPDNDDVGRKHAADVVKSLEGIAARVQVLDLPGVAEKGDVSDWLAAGGTDEQLIKLAAAAPSGAEWLAWQPANQESLAAPPASAARPRGARVVRLADVAPEVVSWLWEGRIPLGKITVFDGDPGLGKSSMLSDLAARLSSGRPLPEETAGAAPADVLFIAHEDGLADTLRPRLDAAGADATRVHVVEGLAEEAGGLRLPSIPGDLYALEAVIRERAIRLVVVDPLYAYLNAGTDAYSDHNVRSALAPLATVAERTRAAVVLVRHLRKTGGASALYRGGGSIGIIGIARSGLLLAKDPDDETARVLACVKSNLGPPPASLVWRFAGGTPPRLEWQGHSKYSADTLVNVQANDEEGRSAMDEARAFLRVILDAGPVLATDVMRQARQAGISDPTLRRAKSQLGVAAGKTSFGGKWEWSLPKVIPSTEGSSSRNVSTGRDSKSLQSNGFLNGPQGDHAEDDQSPVITLGEGVNL